MASGYQRLLSWLGSGDSLQPEAPPGRRRVASQAPALSPQQPPRQRAGCQRIAMVLVHAMPCNVGGAITGGLARVAHVRVAHVIARRAKTHGALARVWDPPPFRLRRRGAPGTGAVAGGRPAPYCCARAHCRGQRRCPGSPPSCLRSRMGVFFGQGSRFCCTSVRSRRVCTAR